MKNKGFKQWLAVLAVLAGLTLAIGAEETTTIQISIWAPGMDEPQLLNSNDDALLLELKGSNWAYVIKGISGDVTLGNENEEGDFWVVGDADTGGWKGLKSWASAGLEVNGHACTETGAFFSVSGNEPGVMSSHTTTYFPNSYVLLADSEGKITISLAPLINSALCEEGKGIANANPTAHLSLLADIYRRPPETSGNLNSESEFSSRIQNVTLHWNFTQGEEATSSNRIQLAAL